jgi:hypothetical protein
MRLMSLRPRRADAKLYCKEKDLVVEVEDIGRGPGFDAGTSTNLMGVKGFDGIEKCYGDKR